jgi:hypothetical protein
MEAVTFWREIERRFEKLSLRHRTPATRLHVTRAFHDTPEKYVEAERDKLVGSAHVGVSGRRVVRVDP